MGSQPQSAAAAVVLRADKITLDDIQIDDDAGRIEVVDAPAHASLLPQQPAVRRV
jgi:hypothetical protein